MTEKIENRIRLIHDYFHNYGLRKTGETIQSQEEMIAMFDDPIKKAKFIKYVHEGYRLGQDLLIKELISNETASQRLKSEQKRLNQLQERNKARELKSVLNSLSHQEAILRNLADSLAWMLMKRQHWVARRWFSGNTSRPSLLNSNIESLHFAAENYYKSHPNGFALYTDLTSFIDIADLIMVADDLSLQVVEVKEGSKSEEVFEFIDKITILDKFDLSELGLETISNPNKFFDQVMRTLNQMSKASRLTQLINEEEGLDPFSGKPTVIGELSKPFRFYHDVIISMFKELKSSIWAYRVIDGIIHIGMYRNQALSKSNELFTSVVSLKSKEDFPIVSYASQIYAPIKEPIFQKPYELENIMDLIFGRTKMLLFVDLDALLKLFNSKGVAARWMTRKETQKAKEKRTLNTGSFEHKHRSIALGKNGKLILGDAFMSRLVYESLLPESLIEMYIDYLRSEINEDH